MMGVLLSWTETLPDELPELVPGARRIKWADGYQDDDDETYDDAQDVSYHTFVPRVLYARKGKDSVIEQACACSTTISDNDVVIDIYLDTCAGVTVIRDKRLLQRLRPAEPILIDGVNGEGPAIPSSLWGDTPLGTGYYCPEARLNLLSFGHVVDATDLQIIYSSDTDEFVIEHVDLTALGGAKGTKLTFSRHSGDDNIYKTTVVIQRPMARRTAASARQLRNALRSHTGVDTVAQRRARYTPRELAGADEAVRVMRSLFFISPGELIRLLAKGSPGVASLGISVQDVVRAVHINGPDIGRLKGMRTAKRPPVIEREQPALEEWVEAELDMMSDILFVNDIPMFLSIFEPIDFPFVTELESRSARHILKAITKTRAAVQRYGPRVRRMLIDRESATISQEVIQGCADLRSGGGPLRVENAGGSSIQVVERLVRTTKERCRASFNTLPYRPPKIIVVWMVKAAVYAIGGLPKRSAEDGRSGRERLTGRGVTGPIDTKFVFGAYVQCDPTETDNTMTERTIAAIALMPTGNLRGSWFFLNLKTWRVFTAESATPLPIPPAVIDLLNERADKDFGKNKKKLKIGTWRSAYINFDDGSDEEKSHAEYQEIMQKAPRRRVRAYVPDRQLDEDAAEVVRADGDDDPEDDDASSTTSSNATDATEDSTPWYNLDELRSMTIDDIPEWADMDDDRSAAASVPAAGDGEPSAGVTAEAMSATARKKRKRRRKKKTSSDVPPTEPPRSARKRSHARSASLARSRFRFLVGLSKKQLRKGVFNITVKKALETLGEVAVKSIAAEISQLHHRGTFEKVDPDRLTIEQARQIISSSCFLKEKFSPTGVFEKLKARLVAGGHLQDKTVYGENDIGSPTASTTSLFIIAGIAAKEGRAVATVDFPGAYLHADLPSDGPEVLMRLNKYEASVLCKIEPEYEKHVDKKKGTLIVRLKKGLYGLVQSAKLWYDHLHTDLAALGFERNAQDICVFNRVEPDGTQTTLVLHVDDLLITAKTEGHIDKLVDDIHARGYKDLEIHRGRELDYLGMHFDWSVEGKCAVTMPGYIDEVLTFANEIRGEAKTPAADNLFEIDDKVTALSDEKREFFHSLTAKLLYLAKRARPDLLLAVSFLARRVQRPTTQDLKKLQRVIRYLRANNKEGMILQPDVTLQAYGWIDASFAVHVDFRSHTGAVVGLGKGPFWTKSSVQKLNSKSSTEAELIGATDSAGQLLWTRQFLLEQGYDVGPAVLYQDNTSTISLINNGRSNSERTRHIAIRYFFLKDRIENKEIRVEYLNTGDMIADILTKPLQGEQFVRLRAKLLNWPLI